MSTLVYRHTTQSFFLISSLLAVALYSLNGVFGTSGSLHAIEVVTPKVASIPDLLLDINTSTSVVPIGDLLFAEVSCKNVSAETVRIHGLDILLVRASVDGRTSMAHHFGEFGLGWGKPQKQLAPNGSLTRIVRIDLFCDSRNLDSSETFRTNEKSLAGKQLQLIASCSPVMADPDNERFEKFWLRSASMIEIGEAIITEENFLARLRFHRKSIFPNLSRYNLVSVGINQSFYVWPAPEEHRGTTQKKIAALHAVRDTFPQNTAVGRYAAVKLLFEELINETSIDTEVAIAKQIGEVVEQAHWIEQVYWLSQMCGGLRRRHVDRSYENELDDRKWTRFQTAMEARFPVAFEKEPWMGDGLSDRETFRIYLLQFQNSKNRGQEMAALNRLVKLAASFPARERDQYLSSALTECLPRGPGDRMSSRKKEMALLLRQEIERLFPVKIREEEKRVVVTSDSL